ncbi:MAG: trypsin-like serine peptidase [Phycisphaerales bacterium]
MPDDYDDAIEFDVADDEEGQGSAADYESVSSAADSDGDGDNDEDDRGYDDDFDGEGSGDLVEEGLGIETHGAGTLESAPGFDENFAMTEGFGAEQVPVDPTLNALPRSCDLEFGESPESVCGRDDRVHVTAVTRVPWRMVCQLIITRRDGSKSRCTGWFISPRTVMTAGHCVYSHSAGGWAKQIEVIPGMNGSLRPFGSAVGTRFYSVKGWTKSRKPGYDYGCIILPKSKPLGKRTGWFGFASLKTSSLKNLLVNNSGYAGDKAFGTQWYNAGRITRVTSRRLYYMLDTFGGHSGSPTWRFRGGKRHAVGIHAYGGCPNKSTRINSKVFKNMKSWKAKGA